MLRDLDVRLETIRYTARYATPTLNLWAAGAAIVGPLYEALLPYGITLQNIQTNNATNASAIGVTVAIPGKFTVKFAFDRMEFEFVNPTVEFFDSIPSLIHRSTSWLAGAKPDFALASHNAAYFCHSFVKDVTSQQFLEEVGPRPLSHAGASRGAGAIFHNFVEKKNWSTRIWLDHSEQIPGALFLALFIDFQSPRVDYTEFFADGRAYLTAVLEDLNLKMPEVAR